MDTIPGGEPLAGTTGDPRGAFVVLDLDEGGGASCASDIRLAEDSCLRFRGIRPVHGNYARRLTMADAGPPLVLMALGLILWLAVNATLAGISIQTIGIILFLVGVVWLLIELVQSRTVARRQRDVVVRDEPVVREREVY
jgi:tetrahydromethanopterin S-methyltransferase subunit E